MAYLREINGHRYFQNAIPPDVLDRIARTAHFTNAEFANQPFMYAYVARDARAERPSDPVASRAAANVLGSFDLSGIHPGTQLDAVIILADALTDEELADGAFLADLQTALTGVTYTDEVVTRLRDVRGKHGYPL